MYIHSTLIINEVQETPSAYVVINIVSNRDSVRPSRIKLYIYSDFVRNIYSQTYMLWDIVPNFSLCT